MQIGCSEARRRIQEEVSPPLGAHFSTASSTADTQQILVRACSIVFKTILNIA